MLRGPTAHLLIGGRPLHGGADGFGRCLFAQHDLGDTEASPAMAATCMIATNGGATLKTTDSIAGTGQTTDAAFVGTSIGWVLTLNANGDEVIDVTSDGGYHWSQQLAVPRPAGG